MVAAAPGASPVSAGCSPAPLGGDVEPLASQPTRLGAAAARLVEYENPRARNTRPLGRHVAPPGADETVLVIYAKPLVIE